MAYSLEVRQKSRDLFVELGLSYEEVARQTGVSINNLKKWGVEGKWTKQRDEYQQAFESLRGKIAKGKVVVTDALLALYQEPRTEKFSSQEVYAHNDTLRTFNTFSNARGDPGADRAAWFLENLEDLIAYLQ